MSESNADDVRKPVGTSVSRYRRMLYEVRAAPPDGRCRHGFETVRCGFCTRTTVRDDGAPVSADGALSPELMRWIARNRTTKPRDRRNVRREPNRYARRRFADSGARRVERLNAVAVEMLAAGTAGCTCEAWRRKVCDWCALLGSIADARTAAEWRKREVRNPVSGRLPLDTD